MEPICTDIIIIANTEMMQNWHCKAKRKTQVASVRKALNLWQNKEKNVYLGEETGMEKSIVKSKLQEKE